MAKEQSDTDEKHALKNDIREYIEKRIELITLTIAEQVSLIIAQSFQRFFGFLILTLALFFAWFAVACFVGELLGRYSAGFAIASVPLFIMALFFMKRKSKRFTEKIQAGLIYKVIENFEEEKAVSKKHENGKE